MGTEQTAFFVVPPAHLDELRRLYDEEPDPDECGLDYGDESAIMDNRLYRRVEEVALHTIPLTYTTDELYIGSVFDYLHKKAGDPDKPDMLGPEHCPAWARAIDAFLDSRGGLEWIFRDMARRGGLKKPLPHWPVEYRDLRAALDRAIADRAGLISLMYIEGAEQRLADRRAEREAEDARIAQKPERSPEERERRLAAIRAELEEHQQRMDEANMRAQPESDPYAPSTSKLQSMSLYTLPAPIVDRLLGMWAEYKRLMGDSDVAMWERAFPIHDAMYFLAWDQAWGFWDMRQRGHESAWRALESALWAAGPAPVSPDNFIHTTEEIPDLAETLLAWTAAQGGRDAAISSIAADTIGESRTHATQTLDNLERLIAEAKVRGHGLVRVSLGGSP